jgi:hypothetical protein
MRSIFARLSKPIGQWDSNSTTEEPHIQSPAWFICVMPERQGFREDSHASKSVLETLETSLFLCYFTVLGQRTQNSGVRCL